MVGAHDVRGDAEKVEGFQCEEEKGNPGGRRMGQYICCLKYLRGGYRKDGVRFFLEVHSKKM